MIICHCTSITDEDVHSAIDWMRAADPDTLITPGKVYRALGKAPDCGGCLPLFLSTMRGNDNLKVPPTLTPVLDDTAEAAEDAAPAPRERHDPRG